MKVAIRITYCTGCNWMLRACWMAQEILASYSEDIEAVSLHPDSSGGVFVIHAGEDVIWDRARDGGFPQIAELKRRIRDVVAPGRDLGHLDRDVAER